jgi:hypothetical protein
MENDCYLVRRYKKRLGVILRLVTFVSSILVIAATMCYDIIREVRLRAEPARNPAPLVVPSPYLAVKWPNKVERVYCYG